MPVIRFTIAILMTAAIGIASAKAQSPATARAVPSDTEIRRILAERVDVYRQSVGVVVGVHLLAGAPLRQFPQPSQETTIDSAIFDRYVGRYQLAPAAILTISRDGRRFLVQLTGQPPYEIFAESETQFFLKVVDAQLTFEVDARNTPIAVTLHQNGVNQRAPRIEGEAVVPKEIALEPAVLDRYVGTYQFAPGVVLSVTRRDARLFAQLTGQPSVEVYASGARDFFYKVVNAQLTFEGEGDGPATAVVLHQNGRDQRAARVSEPAAPPK